MIPFIVVRYWPDDVLTKKAVELGRGEKLELTSKKPFMYYDDLNILGKMKLFENAKNESLIDMLGTLG